MQQVCMVAQCQCDKPVRQIVGAVPWWPLQHERQPGALGGIFQLGLDAFVLVDRRPHFRCQAGHARDVHTAAAVADCLCELPAMLPIPSGRKMLAFRPPFHDGTHSADQGTHLRSWCTRVFNRIASGHSSHTFLVLALARCLAKSASDMSTTSEQQSAPSCAYAYPPTIAVSPRRGL